MESELVRAVQKLRRKMQTFSPRTLDGAVSVWIKDLDAALAAHDAREGGQIDPVAHGKEIAARERLQALHRREQAAQPQPGVAHEYVRIAKLTDPGDDLMGCTIAAVPSRFAGHRIFLFDLDATPQPQEKP